MSKARICSSQGGSCRAWRQGRSSGRVKPGLASGGNCGTARTISTGKLLRRGKVRTKSAAVEHTAAGFHG